MIKEPPPFKGLHMRIPSIIPMKGRGFTNHGSALRKSKTQGLRVEGLGVESLGLRV